MALRNLDINTVVLVNSYLIPGGFGTPFNVEAVVCAHHWKFNIPGGTFVVRACREKIIGKICG